MTARAGIPYPASMHSIARRARGAGVRGLVAGIILLLLAGCGERGRLSAVGPFSDVYLFTEEGVYSPLLRQFVDDLSHRITYVFEPENEYNVYLQSGEHLSKNLDRKNLLLLVRLDREGGLRQRVGRFISQDVLRRARAEGYLVLYKQDMFARNQDTFIILVTGPEQEDYVLSRLGPSVRERLRKTTQDRYRDFLLSTRENKGGRKDLLRRYSFGLRFTAEYHLLQERTDLGAIELHRTDPSRVIGIFWRKAADAAPALDDSLALEAWREALVDTLYHGDYHLDGETRFSEASLGDRAAIRMQGIWQNARDTTGGPFITYFLHDAQRRRWLAVDLVLYAPGMDKHPYIRELEALASTFEF